MKRFSVYPSKTECTSSFRFRKTVNSLNIIKNFWFVKKASQRKTYFPLLHLLSFDCRHLSTCVKHFFGLNDLEISSGLEMVTKFPRPCQGKSQEEHRFLSLLR